MPPEPIETADLSVERSARDLHAVITQLELDRPILLGHSMGCQVILEYLKQYPGGARALVPMFGTFARPLDTFMDSPYSRRAFDVLYRVAGWGGKTGTRMLLPLYDSPFAFAIGKATGLVDKHYAGRVDINKYMEHLVHMDPRVFLRMVSLMADHDLTDFLPQIDVPVLVLAGERDLFTPLHRSYAMADRIPGAELLVLAEASHAAIVEHPDTINLRIERFLEERLGLPEPGEQDQAALA
jgi:pimeloyl-ACP methyl ester carboxylesterase